MSAQYYVVSKATGAVINAVLTDANTPPSRLLSKFPNPHLIELRREQELSERQLQDYEFWSSRP